MEAEENNQIPFLDILIKKNGNELDLSIYRKPNYTGLGVNFISECYENFKFNTFSTMIYRAYRLTSSYMNFHRELRYLENFYDSLPMRHNYSIRPNRPSGQPKIMKGRRVE